MYSLLRKIIQELGKGEVFSTDDFFMLNEKNEYRFVHADLEIAHKWNQQRGKIDCLFI